jgi:diaminopimelate decarboxylase
VRGSSGVRRQGSARARAQERAGAVVYAWRDVVDAQSATCAACDELTTAGARGEHAAPVSGFGYVDGELRAEGVSLSSIAARFGTPCYVYSRAALTSAFVEFDGAFGGMRHLTCYAMKANSNLAILNLFARLGSGFDIVSGGELARVIAAGGDPRKVVFSGVGKTADELASALAADILCFNVESEAELARLASVAARAGKRAPVSIRVNPDVDPQTHPYIATGLRESKFGVPVEAARALYRRAAESASLAVRGIDMHIGSQITELTPYRAAVERLLALVDALGSDGIELAHVDVGGGLGIRYRDETPVPPMRFAAMIGELVAGRPQTLLLEPGRRLVGDAGVLLTRVINLKPGEAKNHAVVDAAMNDLLRPALYDAWHAVDPVRPRRTDERSWDIVGPVCESADFLARDRTLALAEGDLVAIRSAGAYAMSMSSNYNSRPRACEVIVDGESVHVVRRRESVDDLFAHEALLP